MKRRDFLKRAVGVVAGAAVAPIVIKAKTKSMVSGCPSSPSSSVSSVDWQAKTWVASKEEIRALGRGSCRGLNDPTAIWARAAAKQLQENMDKLIIDCMKGKINVRRNY